MPKSGKRSRCPIQPETERPKKATNGSEANNNASNLFYEKYTVETNLAVKIFALRFRHNFRERFIHRFPMQIESSRGAVTDLQRRQIGMDAKDGDRRREMTRIENMDLYHCATYIG